MVIVTVVVVVVVVVVQSNTLKSNVLVNFFFLRGLRFLDLPVHDEQVEPCSRTFWGCTSGGVSVPCIYTHVRWVTAGDSGLCCRACMTSLEPPCVLILQKVLRVKSFLFVCCFCFFALQNDDSWYWSYSFLFAFLYHLLVTQSLEQPNFKFWWLWLLCDKSAFPSFFSLFFFW